MSTHTENHGEPSTAPRTHAQELKMLLTHGTPRIVVVGGGYVGMPLAVVAAQAHCDAIVLEVDPAKVAQIHEGRSYIRDVPSETLSELVQAGRLQATTDPAEAYEGADATLVCVPTPLSKTHDPDVSFVINALDAMIPHLRGSALVSLESTVYPGFTREVVVPKLEAAGFTPGDTIFVAFSPERVDPGNARYHTKNTPKVLGGFTPSCLEVASALYTRLVDRVVPVSTTDAAEMTKILENTFRAVNIGLVNEVAIMCHQLGIDTWEVIDAAATKPFGFMPFFPGPGIGGHCIPIDPFYLSWKMRTLRYEARFIALAGQVNTSMPGFVVNRLAEELNAKRMAVGGTKVLVVGVAYKPDVDDLRESPALEVIEYLHQRGADVSYVDPFVPRLEYDGISLSSLPTDVDPSLFEAAIIVTHHRGFDYERLVRSCPLVVDTRNVTRGLQPGEGTKLVRL
jgi:UDP-N-acetyl-D-glucosamine dehydrogenase